ncbi:MAG: 2-oxoglutarate dehydrogenase complex dihydrolipoyllysine-residue succinyltransferase [Pseudomonadota bacterium]
MLVEVKVPMLSESVSEATLLSWHKKEGEYVERGENLIDVETDKVVLELPAPQAGVLKKIIKGEGSAVTSDDLVATIDTDAKPTAKATAKTEAMVASAKSTEARVMPAAKKIAEEHGVNAAALSGSGRDGRVTKQDVLAQLQAGDQPEFEEKRAGVAGGSRSEQRVPMSRLRQRVAERLVQAQQQAAILTTFNEVNMQAVIDLRNRYKDKFEKQHGIKLGFMSFFVKAAIAALQKFPVVNASVDGNNIVYHGYFDIGIAVGSERGLVVPIVRDADQMSFAAIEKQIADFGARAKEGKITLEELTGGTFSISNGGVFGSMLSTPILNPPQSAILGIHATKERPVVENGQIVIRPMNYLALSYDHRIIDGREAVLFLVAIKEALEDPSRLLLEV